MEKYPVRYLGKKEFAIFLELTPGAITNKFPREAPGVVMNKIDLTHPKILEYIEIKGYKDKPLIITTPVFDLSVQPKINNDQKNDQDIAASIPIPINIPKIQTPEELENLTLSEIVEKYGHLKEFKQYTSTLKELEVLREKKLKNDFRRDQLIDKKTEAKLLFEVLETLFSGLLNDGAMSLSQRVLAIAQKNDDDAMMRIQKEIEEYISRELKMSRDKIIERLKMSDSEVKVLKK